MTDQKQYQIKTTCHKRFPDGGRIYRRFSLYGAMWKRYFTSSTLCTSRKLTLQDETSIDPIPTIFTQQAIIKTIQTQPRTRKEIMTAISIKNDEKSLAHFNEQIETLKALSLITEENERIFYTE